MAVRTGARGRIHPRTSFSEASAALPWFWSIPFTPSPTWPRTAPAIGVQVVEAPWREDLVLAAMAPIEAITERARFRPRRP